VWLLVFFTNIWCYKTGTAFIPCVSLFLRFPHILTPQILRYGNSAVFPSVRDYRLPLCCSLDFRSSEILISNFFILGKVKGKGKAVPLQAWSVPDGSRKLRFTDYMATAQDGGKVVSPTHRPPLPLGNAPGTHFC